MKPAVHHRVVLALPLTLEKSLNKFVRAVYRCGCMHKTRSNER